VERLGLGRTDPEGDSGISREEGRGVPADLMRCTVKRGRKGIINGPRQLKKIDDMQTQGGGRGGGK